MKIPFRQSSELAAILPSAAAMVDIHGAAAAVSNIRIAASLQTAAMLNHAQSQRYIRIYIVELLNLYFERNSFRQTDFPKELFPVIYQGVNFHSNRAMGRITIVHGPHATN